MTEIDPDESSEIHLNKIKRSFQSSSPTLPIPGEVLARQAALAKAGAQALPPREQLAADQIEAWNGMADQMIKVVRTIKTNERKLKETETRIQHLGWFVVAVMVVSVAGNVLVSLENRKRTETLYQEITRSQQQLLDSIEPK